MLFVQESKLADTATLQVDNMSNDKKRDLKQYPQQHCLNPQAVQDPVTHPQEPVSSSMVRLQHLFTYCSLRVRRAVFFFFALAHYNCVHTCTNFEKERECMCVFGRGICVCAHTYSASLLFCFQCMLIRFHLFHNTDNNQPIEMCFSPLKSLWYHIQLSQNLLLQLTFFYSY